MKASLFTINSESTLDFIRAHITEKWHEKKWMQVSLNFDKNRTLKQNSAIHVYFKLLADALNDAGLYYVFEFNGKQTKCDWTPNTVKERLWRPIQTAVTNKKSSTTLTTDEIQQVYENLNRHTAERLGVSVEFPSVDK